MFAIEIAFTDGVSQPETILVRRPQALIGFSDYAHVAIEDMRELAYQIRIIRDLGRRFRTKAVFSGTDRVDVPEGVDGSYDGSVVLNLGRVRLTITAIDVDLQVKESESPDRAGVRILRQALAAPSPNFPAVVVRGATPLVVSFSSEYPIYVGRSNQCAIRLDSADVSARHARIGFEGREFWVEDLGSTNGTFVNEQQISGRVNVAPGHSIVIGREVTLVGVANEDDLISATRSGDEAPKTAGMEKRFPILISVSEMARPARLVLVQGAQVGIGRDPSCEMWIGAPHISRRHCSVKLLSNGSIEVTDSSTNGTGYDGGLLKQGEIFCTENEPKVLDFGGGVTVGICFDESQEQKFKEAQGAPRAFNPANQISPNTDERSWAAPAVRAANRHAVGVRNDEARRNSAREMFLAASPFGRLTMLFLVASSLLVIGVMLNLILGVWFR